MSTYQCHVTDLDQIYKSIKVLCIIDIKSQQIHQAVLHSVMTTLFATATFFYESIEGF